VSFVNELKSQARAVRGRQERETADLEPNAAQFKKARDLVSHELDKLSVSAPRGFA
jgi:hypothetical protein